MELPEWFKTSRTTSTRLDNSKTSSSKSQQELNRELNLEIRPKGLLILSTSRASSSTKESSPNKQERSSWEFLQQEAWHRRTWRLQVVEVVPHQLLLPLEITVNMEVLEAKIFLEWDTTMPTNTELKVFMIHTQRQRASQPVLKLLKRRRRRKQLSMIIAAQIQVTLMLTAMIQMLKEKRRRSKRKRQRKKLLKRRLRFHNLKHKVK